MGMSCGITMIKYILFVFNLICAVSTNTIIMGREGDISTEFKICVVAVPTYSGWLNRSGGCVLLPTLLHASARSARFRGSIFAVCRVNQCIRPSNIFAHVCVYTQNVWCALYSTSIPRIHGDTFRKLQCTVRSTRLMHAFVISFPTICAALCSTMAADQFEWPRVPSRNNVQSRRRELRHRTAQCGPPVYVFCVYNVCVSNYIHTYIHTTYRYSAECVRNCKAEIKFAIPMKRECAYKQNIVAHDWRSKDSSYSIHLVFVCMNVYYSSILYTWISHIFKEKLNSQRLLPWCKSHVRRCVIVLRTLCADAFRYWAFSGEHSCLMLSMYYYNNFDW